MLSKLPDIGTTIFTKMSALANEYNAVNLSQGFPNFSIDEKLKNFVVEALNNEQVQYAPMAGRIDLREEISRRVFEKYSISIHPEKEITITAGATQGIFTAIATVINPGDEVILFDPSYDCYDPSIRTFGGKPIHLNLSIPEFKIDWASLRKQISHKTKLLIFNNPNNPAGSVWEQEDFNELLAILNENPTLYFISDEVYEYITFNKPHLSFLQYEHLRNRSFAIYSFGKTFHVTGWKIGYVIAPANLTNEFRKIHQFNVFCVNNTMQYALANYLKTNPDFKLISELYQGKMELFVNKMQQSRFKMLSSQGTYFVLADYSKISIQPDTIFAEEMTIHNKVASIPVSVFYADKTDNHLIRFCIAKTDETLEQALDILCKI